MIRVQNIQKYFDGHAVVNGLSFCARDGAITGLLGANGAGKTTTLRIICGVLTPESGSVIVDDIGEDPDRRGRRRRLGALLDHSGLYARLTVRENLVYFGRLHGMPRELLEDRVNQVISVLGLNPIADRRAAGLSQGQHMKAALGRAMLHAPQNLILDEPTNALDVPTVRSLRDVLRELRNRGICILYSSHVLEEVRALCDRIVIISEGRLVAEGSPAEVCARMETLSLEEAFIKMTQTEAASC